MTPALPQARRKRGWHAPSRAERARFARVAWLVVGAAVLVGMVATVGLGSAVHNDIACDSCHQMEAYVEAHADSAHQGVACSVCHARPGVAGMIADGVRAARWITRWPGTETPSAAWAPDDACVTCHELTMTETIEARGIMVRHSDFAGEPCGTCHAGRGHILETRGYLAPQMEYCMECHRTASTELATCEVCHPPEAASERSPGWSTWRAAHGRGWEQSHGMADLDECKTCHAPQYCVGCHGTQIPHGAEWPKDHGAGAVTSGKDACVTCHDAAWCVTCHGVEMPHAETFLPAHGPIADESGDEVCAQCHSPAACQACHIASSHPNLPVVGMGTHDDEVSP